MIPIGTVPACTWVLSSQCHTLRPQLSMKQMGGGGMRTSVNWLLAHRVVVRIKWDEALSHCPHISSQ